MIFLDPQEVEAAQQGDRAALDRLLRSAERPVYNLAIRFLAHPADAEDATQEILILIITNLGALRETTSAGAWAMRIACRHLVGRRKKSRVEKMRLTFEGFAKDLEQGLSDPPDAINVTPETTLAIEEIKISCTLAVLTCLSRPLRIAYVLGEIFEMADSESARILEISPTTYRQRLKRARAAVTEFVSNSCGIVAPQAACRCERRLNAAETTGRVKRGHPIFDRSTEQEYDLPELRTHIRALEEGRKTAALMRSNPDFNSKITELVIELTKPGLHTS
ncbi:RNA polymerase sigma factor [Sneathiella sp. CAU 1612]|uniref:RNA polymerase sigma factor n=1 Tax=Sneathiella sedimenti TaxID=2816034 RepID=A0ABS3F8N2_9PROT|nr:RNA polymerase sigma factor [Sneathiella sedimenti]